jgi:chemotaxis protein MotB
MRKKKSQPPKKALTAPFFLLTFGDMMTLILTFFVLLFSVSTLEVVKFQAQIGAIQGALGISQFYSHAPMQKELPAPAIKVRAEKTTPSIVKPTNKERKAEQKRKDLTEPSQQMDNEQIREIKAIGIEGNIEVNIHQDEVILVLPSFGIFKSGSYEIDPNSRDVKRSIPLYNELGKQIAMLTNYEIEIVGHTDSLPYIMRPGALFPRNNMELGFMRAVSMYEFFFKNNLPDKTRITFASQGDNVPIVPDANLDSARRKNRRVEIILRKLVDPDQD